MKKINIEELENISFEDGEKLLLNSGYIDAGNGTTESNISDYASGEYFTLYDDGEEIHTVQHAYYCNRVDDDEDIIVKEVWEEL